jgi:ABC-type lipoprotein export system ATPase subunit/predicted acetyltransferase
MTTINLVSDIKRTPRVMQIEGMFDIDAKQKSITSVPLNFPDLNERDWNIGLIVGPSGAGKTTVAKNLFNQELEALEKMEWIPDTSVVDNFPKNMTIKDITELLSSVGFSSPPAWLRAYQQLSNGEKFRVSMARLLAEQKDLAVVDEFTSVVDRTVAQIGSYAIGKTIRKRNQKFVAVTCHYDVEDWLQPDWVYQPATGEFFWGSLRPRPNIGIEIIKSNHASWKYFSRHHYLDHDLNKAAAVYVVLINNQPAGLCAILPLPHGHLQHAWRISRLVILPDFQGIGLAHKFINLIGGAYKRIGRSLYITTSHPALMHGLNNSKEWSVTRKPSRVARPGVSSKIDAGRTSISNKRITTGFKYVGSVNDELNKIIN